MVLTTLLVAADTVADSQILDQGLVAIVVSIVSALGLIGVAALNLRLREEVRMVGRDTAATRYQVQNSHTENLRDALDVITDGVQNAQRQIGAMSQDLGGIHSELSVIQKTNVDLYERVNTNHQQTMKLTQLISDAQGDEALERRSPPPFRGRKRYPDSNRSTEGNDHG